MKKLIHWSTALQDKLTKAEINRLKEEAKTGINRLKEKAKTKITGLNTARREKQNNYQLGKR